MILHMEQQMISLSTEYTADDFQPCVNLIGNLWNPLSSLEN